MNETGEERNIIMCTHAYCKRDMYCDVTQYCIHETAAAAAVIAIIYSNVPSLCAR